MISHHFPYTMAYWGIPHVYRQTAIYVQQPAIGLVGPTEGCPIRRCSDKGSRKKLLQLAIMHFTGESKEPLGKSSSQKQSVLSVCEIFAILKKQGHKCQVHFDGFQVSKA